MTPQLLLLSLSLWVLVACTEQPATPLAPTPAAPTAVSFGLSSPVATSTSPAPTAVPPALTPLPTAVEATAVPPPTTAASSPTPFLYTVMEGDTLSGVAATFGLTLAEIQALNPGLDPNVLQVGQTLRLPDAVAPTAVPPEIATQAALAAGEVIVTQARLVPSPVGITWVLGEVVNGREQAVERVQLEVSVQDAAGAPLASGVTPAAVELLPPQSAAPFGLLLDQSLPPDAQLTVTVRESTPLSNLGARTVNFAATAVTLENEAGYVQITGEVQNQGETTAKNIQVITTFYDEQGRVTGFNQQRLAEALESGATVPFRIESVPPAPGTVDVGLVFIGETPAE